MGCFLKNSSYVQGTQLYPAQNTTLGGVLKLSDAFFEIASLRIRLKSSMQLQDLAIFIQMKEKVGGRWWLKGEEDNNQLIEFVNSWLDTWVGYVEETVFDVNMLSVDENTIICNNYNKDVFEHFKKHKIRWFFV